MKLLTKNTDYAVRALLYLAQHRRRFISSREISQQEKIPLYYLRRILRILITGGVVVAKEGVAGGVKLRRKPENIGLLAVIKMFQGDIQLTECLFRKNICRNRDHCVLRRKIKKIEQKIVAEFKGITIGSLLKKQEAG